MDELLKSYFKRCEGKTLYDFYVIRDEFKATDVATDTTVVFTSTDNLIRYKKIFLNNKAWIAIRINVSGIVYDSAIPGISGIELKSAIVNDMKQRVAQSEGLKGDVSKRLEAVYQAENLLDNVEHIYFNSDRVGDCRNFKNYLDMAFGEFGWIISKNQIRYVTFENVNLEDEAEDSEEEKSLFEFLKELEREYDVKINLLSI